MSEVNLSLIFRNWTELVANFESLKRDNQKELRSRIFGIDEDRPKVCHKFFFSLSDEKISVFVANLCCLLYFFDSKWWKMKSDEKTKNLWHGKDNCSQVWLFRFGVTLPSFAPKWLKRQHTILSGLSLRCVLWFPQAESRELPENVENGLFRWSSSG